MAADDADGMLRYFPYGAPTLYDDLVIRFGKQVFLLSGKDYELVRFLDALVYVRRLDETLKLPRKSLLTFRDDFRGIVRNRPIAGLLRCVLERVDEEQLRLAAWLLGKCGDRTVTPILADLGKRYSEAVRRDIVRALRRLEDYRTCQSVATYSQDPRTRRIAGLVPRKFNEILKKWHVGDDLATPVPRHPFEILVEIGQDAPVRPKSREFFRRILGHIRFLLRGAV